MKPWYRSKKWWTAAIAALVPVINQVTGLGLDAAEIATVVIPLALYVLGEAHADANH